MLQEPGDRWRQLGLKLIRFALAGGLATALYGLFAVLLHQVLDVSNLAIHTMAFVLAIPVSYLGQSLFTFRYRGARTPALGRFAVVSLAAFLASSAATHAAAVSGAHFIVGVVVTMLIVPLVSFFAMLLWVFADRQKHVRMTAASDPVPQASNNGGAAE
jgi:putative flippase GtrA